MNFDMSDTRYRLVRAVVERHDPLGLLSQGLADEYDPEIRAIMPRIGAMRSREDLENFRDSLHSIFSIGLYIFRSKNGARPLPNVAVGRKEDYGQLAEALYGLKRCFFTDSF